MKAGWEILKYDRVLCRRMNKLQLLFLLSMLILSMTAFPASAKEYHMKILAVTENPNEPSGMTADLYLEVKPGSGHIYMDTFPLTKLDTQMSTRFANSIACNYLGMDCDDKDFFYTIRSNSIIVGGPSAGSAITLLTIAALKGYKIDDSISITGTINSGGIIGPVGGLEPKIEAAARSNLSKVLIPQGERFISASNSSSNSSNETIDLYEVGRESGVMIREVATIDDVLFEFTGKRLWKNDTNISVDKNYEDIMESLAGMLCSRSAVLKKSINNSNSSLLRDALNLTMLAETATAHGQYYTAASYCFGANVKLNNEFLAEKNSTRQQIMDFITKYKDRIAAFDKQTEAIPLKTMSDLEAYEVVKERLIEAEDHMRDTVLYLDENDTKNALYSLAFGIERYNSALSWSSFFGMGGKEVELDQQSIKDSCIQKISEAEERYQYVQLYVPLELKDTRTELDRAYQDKNNGNYPLCLFKATKAKAEADVFLGLLGMPSDNIGNYLDTKLTLVRQHIARQQQEGNFPILGYSYYEYANNLKDSDVYSALTYSEYALELSNLDIYFTKSSKRWFFSLPLYDVVMFGLGAIFGLLLGLLLLTLREKKHKSISIKIKGRRKH